MSERQPIPPLSEEPVDDETSDARPTSEGGRAAWTRDDDELILLDAIEESPDDERIADLV